MKTDLEFLNDIYQMRSAQKDAGITSKNFSARAKARLYENKVDIEVERRKQLIINP